MKITWFIAAALAAAPSLAIAGTVAHYRFENDNPGVAVDETGVNNGSILNGAVFSGSVGQNPIAQTGASNAQSLSLNGTNQYVNVPHNSSLNFGANPWTIEAYINVNALPTTATPGQWLAQKKATASDDFQEYGFLIGGNRSGQFGSFGKPAANVTGTELRVELGTGTGLVGVTSFLQVPAAATWIFVSAAYDGTSIRFTLDDNLSDNLPGSIDTIAVPAFTHVTGTGPLAIGGKFNAVGALAQPFGGLIDEVRISDVVVAESDLLSVPEPSTWILATLGALAIGLVARRRKAA